MERNVMSEENYIRMLEDGLNKKVEILAELQEKNKEQAAILKDDGSSPDDLDSNIEQKSVLVEQLIRLDDGFEQLYQRVKEELDENRQQHAEAIARMQELIKKITDYSARVEAQERHNHDLAKEKFSSVRTQIREVQQNKKLVSSYYQNMMRVNYIDPQFMDSKN